MRHLLCLLQVVVYTSLAAEGVDLIGQSTACVRRDGDFGNGYNNQYADWPSNRSRCDMAVGPPGTNVLYARGGLGNQLHCMAALQRLDPQWRAFDDVRREYLSDEFHEFRIAKTPADVTDAYVLGSDRSIYPFPACEGGFENHKPCNCWNVLALVGDACGKEEEKNVSESETLLRKSAAAFEAIPIKPFIKNAAKIFVDEQVAVADSKRRRKLIGIHTRTGVLEYIDGVHHGAQQNARVERRRLSRSMPMPNLGSLSYNTTPLVRAVRHEIRQIVATDQLLPTVLIASDNARVSHQLTARLRESRFLTMDLHNESLAPAFEKALEATPTLHVVMAHHSQIRSLGVLENDMIELLTLSHADVIIKDNSLRESTYSEAAWWIGGAKAKRVHVPYPQRDLLPKCLKEGTAYT